jgi:hypothetical protein
MKYTLKDLHWGYADTLHHMKTTFDPRFWRKLHMFNLLKYRIS